jgi:hypothetical protein
MNLKQVRLIDPVLTNIAIGYQKQEYVGHNLFPKVPVQVSGGQVIQFGTEQFRQYNIRRAPGGNTARIQFGYAGVPYALVQDALEVGVPREWMRDASVVPGINLGTRAVRLGLGVAQLALESEQAVIATNASLYGSDNKIDLGASSWFDPDRNPIVDVATAQEAIGDSIGMVPNVLLLSGKAFAAARSNPHVLARFTGLQSGSVSAAQLASVFDVERVVVGRARYQNGAGAFVQVWGLHAVLAYAAPANSSMDEPSYGYTYEMEGHPLIESPYYDESAKSWIYPATYERAPQLTGVAAGYFFEDAGAPFSG